MPKQIYTLNDFSGGINSLKDPRDIAVNELVHASNIMVDQQGAIRTRGNADSHSYIDSQTATLSGGFGLTLLESDYETEPTTATATACLDFLTTARFYKVMVIANINGGTDTVTTTETHNLAVGDVVYISGTSNYNNTYTVSTVPSGTTFTATLPDAATETSGTCYDTFTNFNQGDEIKLSGTASNDGYYKIWYKASPAPLIYTKPLLTASGANDSGTLTKLVREDNIILLSDAANGSIDVFSVNTDDWTNAQITIDSTGGNIKENAKTVYYSINNATRSTDANFNNSSRVRWYGYIKRTHFEGATAVDFYGPDFFEKDNKLSPPTDGAVGDTYPDDEEGFDLHILTPANSASTWVAGTYQVAASFIYDGNQESLLFEYPSSTHDFDVAAGDSVTVSVHAHTSGTGYNPRISGARIYARVDGSDESWFLLCDVDMRRGARATLDGDYIAWTDGGSAATDIDTGVVTSLFQNLDTYESLNGYNNDVESNSIGDEGEQWKWGLVANRRAFIFNVRRKVDNTGELSTFGDRIYYSEAGRFDTFPTDNYIDAVLGDSESYIVGLDFADRILAFKQNSVQIINISSPSPVGWFLEENYKHLGVKHPAAAVKTENGVCWINDRGCYLFNGSSIKNLIDNKIDDETWATFIRASTSEGFSTIGYDINKKQLFVMRDCTATSGGDSSDCYIHDFKSRSWVFADDAFTSNVVSTNFINDTNGFLTLGVVNSNDIDFKEWDNNDTGTVTGIKLTTKDIDFGQPGLIKKIYKVYITYKNNGAALSSNLYYALDGSTTFINTHLSSTFSNSITNWDVAVCTFSTIKSCQSIAFQIAAGSGTRLDINDISIEYRIINKKVS